MESVRKYVCTTKCYFEGQVHVPGAIYEYDSNQAVSRHLIPLDSAPQIDEVEVEEEESEDNE